MRREMLGVQFRDLSVLLEALVHRSYNNEYPEAPCLTMNGWSSSATPRWAWWSPAGSMAAFPRAEKGSLLRSERRL